MNEMETLVEAAFQLEQQGEKEEALITLSKAFDLLIDEAGAYARSLETSTDLEVLRTRAPQLLENSNKFLRQDLKASMLLNNMGLLFMELDQFDAAKQKFEESISLTPPEENYNDPQTNLQALMEKIAALQSVEEENSLEE